MDKKSKYLSAIVLGTVLWILLIVLIVRVSSSTFSSSEASKQLVAGLVPTIIVLFIFKSLPLFRSLKSWSSFSNEEKMLWVWAMISGDFIFSGYMIYKKYQPKLKSKK